jgi:trimethylamine--corrinoid protein Co-methyltransferase
MAYAAATLTDKMFMGNVVTAENAKDVIRMAEIIHGGRAKIEETPALISLINCNSPLRWDDRMLDSLREYALAGQPVICTPFLLMGAMSPVTIPASLAQQIAEALTGIALVQVIRPGAPVVFGSFLSNIDMQSGSPQFGTPESGIGLLATGQIARHFGLPFRGGGGLNSAHTADYQAGYQTMMTMMPTMLAGTNFVLHAAGWLEGGLVSSYEKFILDIEVLESLLHEFKPVTFDEAALAFGAHLEVGHGGHFLGAEHTMGLFRTAFYRPWVSTAESFDRWTKNGAKLADARALDVADKKLAAYEQPAMDPQVLAELDEFVAMRKSQLDG